MTHFSRLLDKVFLDDEADLILGEVTSKPKSSTRTVNSTAQSNFADVRRFFQTHGRLPQNAHDNLDEQGVWSKLQGIIRNPAVIAQVCDLDDCNILASSREHPKHSPLHLVAKAVQTAIADAQQELEQMSAWLSECLAARTFDETAHQRLQAQLLAMATRLQAAAETTPEQSIATVNDTAQPYPDALLDTVVPQPSAPSSSPESPMLPLETVGVTTEPAGPAESLTPDEPAAPCSIDDVFADDDLDALLGPDEPESAILSGHRATKVFDRTNSDQTNREPCAEFERYKPQFDAYRAALDDGRLAVSSKTDEALKAGDLFLWDGLIALLTDKIGDGDIAEHSGERRQVIFSNGTEAWLREGSIKRCMYVYGDRGNKIVCKRLVPVTENIFGPAAAESDAGNEIDPNAVTGYIYVARTLSSDPSLSKIRKTAVKIGVTKNPVHLRVTNAENDATFLFAKVDVVNTFTLHNLDPRKVEEILHAFFAGARLKIRAKDRFGKDVTATEWFLLQPKLVTQAVELLLSNTLGQYRFSPRAGKIERKG